MSDNLGTFFRVNSNTGQQETRVAESARHALELKHFGWKPLPNHDPEQVPAEKSPVEDEPTVEVDATDDAVQSPKRRTRKQSE